MKSTPVILRNSSTQMAMPTRECNSPLGVANGYIITRPPYQPGDYLTYVCSTGFFMTGSPSLKCSAMFTWLGSPPHCNPLDFAPKVYNNKSEISQVPLWLLVTFSSLLALFVITSALLLLCHCCFSKRCCMLPASRAKVRHIQWPHPSLQKSDEEQEVQDIPEQPQQYIGPKCKTEQKKVSAVSNNQQSNNYSLGNYGKILNEAMVAQSCIGDSLPVIYAIPINPNSNQVRTVNGSGTNITIPTEVNSGTTQKFQLATSVSNQEEIYSIGSRPNEPIVYVESDSCVYSDREVAQRFKQTSNKATVKQQSAFNETCRGQRRSFQAVKPLGQWLPHSRPVRNINTSTQ